MKISCRLYGCMGFLSLLGFIGVFTEEWAFLGFFGFAVNFEYLFIKSDEMIEEYLNKSAATAFYFGVLSLGAVTLINYLFISKNGAQALTSGLVASWIVSILINTAMVLKYSISERWNVLNDKK